MINFAWHNRMPIFLSLLAGVSCLCALAGCNSLPRSGFDPSGQRLFESRPLVDCPLFNRNTDTSPPIISSTPIADSSQQPGASIYSPPPSALPGDFGAARTNPAVPQYGSTATAVPPGGNAVTTAMILSPDAGPRHVFADTGGYALPTVPISGPAMIMTPREQIAPLGSEVVLIASRLGDKDRLVTNEKVEWTLEGVGTIEQLDAGSCYDLLLLDCVHAKKVTDRYAITKTSSVYQTLDRGTPDTTDDVHLLRGQTWVSVNSMKEGTTHVTAFAPNMADWSKRTDVGIIHWVDAQWVVPRLPIAPVGESRVLTTTVLRATNGQPRNGWIVRYEILNGPAAGLGGSGAQIEEIETDFSGQATTILTPHAHSSGVNTIRIQIIRPAGVDGDRRVTVGSETVRQTWSGTPNILLNITGLKEAGRGQDLPYEITAENRSSMSVPGVIALPIPPLAEYIRSEPLGMVQGSTVLWNVNLPPNSTTKVNVTVRQGTAGSLWLRPEFRSSSGMVTTPVPAPSPAVPVPVPSPSDQGASVFPGIPPTPPPNPAVEPTPQPGAQIFAPTPTTPPKPSLSVEMLPNPYVPVRLGQPFRFLVRITNTGATEIRNIVAFIPFPTDVVLNSIIGISTPLTVDGRPPTPADEPKNMALGFHPNAHQAGFVISSLKAGETAHAELQYPTIGQQGYNISCIVLVEGEEVMREARTISP